MHCVQQGSGDPVVLLHQTPRSADEYREVLPLLARRHRAMALDTIGFGCSDPPPWRPTIERYAAVVLEALDALGVRRAAVVGHHTGGVIAIELAARAPERVDRLVLSSTPYVDAESRARRADAAPIDEVRPDPEGRHLTELWQRRRGFYPPDRPELLERFVRDALRAQTPLEDGHRAVGAYRMEDRIGRVRAPVLLIGATADPFAHPDLPRLAERLPGCRVVELAGGTVALPDQLPEEFAAAMLDFLA